MANLSKSRRNSTHETDKCVLSISCWCAFAERKNKHTGVPTVRYTSHDVFKNPSFVHIPHSPKSESVCDNSFIDPNCVQFCQRIHTSLHNHTYTLCLMCLCRCCSALVVMSRKPPQLLRSVWLQVNFTLKSFSHVIFNSHSAERRASRVWGERGGFSALTSQLVGTLFQDATNILWE